MLKVLSSILCDLDPKVKVIGQKAGICDGLPSTSALVNICSMQIYLLLVGLLIHCTPQVNSIFPLFLVILFFSNPSINYFQADFSAY